MLIHLLELGGLPAPAYPKAVGGGGWQDAVFYFCGSEIQFKTLI